MHVMDLFFADGWKFIYRLVLRMIEWKKESFLTMNLDQTEDQLRRMPRKFFKAHKSLTIAYEFKVTHSMIEEAKRQIWPINAEESL